jgi:hypothetical protein
MPARGTEAHRQAIAAFARFLARQTIAEWRAEQEQQKGEAPTPEPVERRQPGGRRRRR